MHIDSRATAGQSARAAADSASSTERDLEGRQLARRTVSVLPFSVTTADPDFASLGHGLAELLAADLAVSHRLAVVERARLDDAKREMALSATGVVDPVTAVRMGRLVAAKTLVMGSVRVPADSSLSFQADVADVATGGISFALDGHTTVSRLFEAERSLLMKLFTSLGVVLTKDERATLDAALPPNPQAFIAFSKGVEAESRGDLPAAAAHYEAAAAIDPHFQAAVQHRQVVEQHALALGIDLRQAKTIAPAGATAAESKGAPAGATAAESKSAPAAAAAAAEPAPAAGGSGTATPSAAQKTAKKGSANSKKPVSAAKKP